LPGRVVVVGIVSLLPGLLGVLGGGLTMYRLYDAYTRSVPPAPPAPLPPLPPFAPADARPYSGDFVRDRGLLAADRAALLAAVRGHVSLPPDRILVPDRFLRDAGKDALGAGTADGPLTREAVSRQLRDVGQAGQGPDGAARFGTHFVVTRGGRLDINNSLVTLTDPADRVLAIPRGDRGARRPARVSLAPRRRRPLLFSATTFGGPGSVSGSFPLLPAPP
jgi:hypothetical protein